MGLLSKAATFTILNITGSNLPSLAEVKEMVENTPVKEIEGSSDKESYGFCKIDEVFEVGAVQGETVLGFGLRQDKKTISNSLFRKKFREALKKAKIDARARKAKITKEDKEMLKENILGELYAEASPIEKLTEILWDTERNQVYFGATQAVVIDSFIRLVLAKFSDVTVTPLNPLSPETKHADLKGSRDNFQNAFFTWIFYETKVKKDILWNPNNIKLLKGDTTVTIKGDTTVSLEAYLSIYGNRLVDSLDLGYNVGTEASKKEYQVTLKRGSWSLMKVKISPEIVHENNESAVFERAASFREFVSLFLELVKQYEAIRNDAAQDKKFWDSLHNLASDHIKKELEAL